jgi:hypothetical protein
LVRYDQVNAVLLNEFLRRTAKWKNKEAMIACQRAEALTKALHKGLAVSVRFCKDIYRDVQILAGFLLPAWKLKPSYPPA